MNDNTKNANKNRFDSTKILRVYLSKAPMESTEVPFTARLTL